jgi:hypothetical protein
MYIANQNYLCSAGFVKEGDEVENPSKRHIQKGLVREVKVLKPEIKEDAHTESVSDKSERKPTRTAKRNKQSNRRPANQSGQ